MLDVFNDARKPAADGLPHLLSAAISLHLLLVIHFPLLMILQYMNFPKPTFDPHF